MGATPPAARAAGPRLTRRGLLRTGAALGVAAAGSHGWPFDTGPRATAMQRPGRADWNEFDRAIETGAQVFGIVGTAVAVVNAAGLVHQHTVGWRDLATAAPLTSHSLFRVGSTTKSMSAL